MKSALIAMVLMVSAQAFGSVNLDLNNSNVLSSDLRDYLARKLTACSQGVTGETFTVNKIESTFDVVDNGIVDYYYTVNIGYSVNNESLGALEVKMIDWDYANYKTIDEKVSFEISQDSSNLCK